MPKIASLPTYSVLFSLGWLLLAVPRPSFAESSSQRDADSLTWVSAKGKSVQTVTKSYEELRKSCDLSFKARSLHPMLNPTKAISDWKGLGFKWVIAQFGRKFAPTDDITLVASDGYAAQLSVLDLTQPQGMIALFQDGTPLEPKRGGPQSLFPDLDPKLPHDMLCDCWGVWYLNVVIFGDLPPELAFEKEGKRQVVTLTAGPNSKKKSLPYRTPTGHFKFLRTNTQTKMVRNPEVTYEPLHEIVKNRFSQATVGPLLAQTYYGKDIPLDKPEDWNIEFQWQGKGIPAKVGGPFHLCHKDRTADCVFFVKALKAKP